MPALAVAGYVLAAAALAGYYSARATSWAVMSDELQVARLATSIAESFSPVPTIHGAYYGAHSQLYPLLLAPLYGTLSAPDAATAGRALNALLLASAAWPAFLLGRAVVGSRGAGYVAAALTVFTPWLVLASALLTENAAYPAFVWAVFLCHRSLASPSAARDLAALAGILLAFLARTQLVALGVAFPIALLLHEIGFELRRGSMRAAVRHCCSSTVREHRVLAVAYLGAAVAAGGLVLAGSLSGVVGNYDTTLSGDLLPPGLWRSAAAHLDQIVVGTGVLPAALATSWAVTAALRTERKEAHAFAALLVVLVPLLTFQVTSFDLRFTADQFIQERYLFYLVPLFAVGAAAWLTQETETTLRLVTLPLAGAAVVALLGLASYDETLIFWASPAAAFHPVLTAASGSLGLSTNTFLQLAGAIAVILVGSAALRAPRATTVGATLLFVAFGAAQAGYVFQRQVEPAMTRPYDGNREWIDASHADGRSAALVPGGRDGPVPWWEAEFWNKRVDRVLRVDEGPVYTPFPVEDVTVDHERGVLSGALPNAADLAVSETETRFELAGRRVASNQGLALVRARRPYPLEWATLGLTDDGWLPAERFAILRLYGHGLPERRTVTLTLAAPAEAREPVTFRILSGASMVQGGVDPGGARPPVHLSVCVPGEGYAEVWFASKARTELPDGRVVALQVTALSSVRRGRCETPPRDTPTEIP